jgi:hypothetical protein
VGGFGGGLAVGLAIGGTPAAAGGSADGSSSAPWQAEGSDAGELLAALAALDASDGDYAYGVVTGKWQGLLLRQSGVWRSPALHAVTLSESSIDLGGTAWVTLEITNSLDEPLPVRVDVDAGDIVVDESGLLLDGDSTTDLRIYRTATSSGTGTIILSDGPVSTIEVAVSLDALNWAEHAAAAGASHSYAFASGVETEDGIGALDITTGSLGSYGAAAIAGADGTLVHSGGVGVSPLVANATWHRFTDHTVVMAVTIDTLTTNRALFMGPGPNGTASSLASLRIDATHLQAETPVFGSSGALADCLTRATGLHLLAVRTARTDASSQCVEHFYSRDNAAAAAQITVSKAASGTNGSWWFGGDGSSYNGNAATYHFFHVYDRALTPRELDAYATLIGVLTRPE